MNKKVIFFKKSLQNSNIDIFELPKVNENIYPINEKSHIKGLPPPTSTHLVNNNRRGVALLFYMLNCEYSTTF